MYGKYQHVKSSFLYPDTGRGIELLAFTYNKYLTIELNWILAGA